MLNPNFWDFRSSSCFSLQFFFLARVFAHPNFKRAERILDNREKDRSDVGEVEYFQGDVIIRPSSKGNLTIFFVEIHLKSKNVGI